MKNKKLRRLIFLALAILVVLCFGLGVFFLNDATVKLFLFPTPATPLADYQWNIERFEDVDKSSIQESLDEGVRYIYQQQKTDGSLLYQPGFTAVGLSVITDLVDAPDETDPYVQKTLKYLLALQQEDGSFYEPYSMSKGLSNYTTSYVLMALSQIDREVYKKEISRAQAYLLSAQRAGQSYQQGESNYGGFGYSASGSGADLSNLHTVLKALRESGVSEDHEVYRRALQFIEKCQDSEGNENGLNKASGGFVYEPEMLKQGKDPYGVMSFAGLDSLLLCHLDKEDSRVLEAKAWISKNYSVKKHPGRGRESLFYYYATMARALGFAEMDSVKLVSGEKKDWPRELAFELMKLQRSDGSWLNSNGKYLEGQPVIATLHAIQALSFCYKNIKD